VEKSNLLIAFLAGVIVAMGTALVIQNTQFPQAQAQSASDGPTMFAVTGTGNQGQSKDVLFLVDPQSPRLCVYEYQGGRLTLAAVRNIEYELRFQEWAPRGKDQTPPVREMLEASEEQPEDGGRRRR
jgi:hypothetical protein